MHVNGCEWSQAAVIDLCFKFDLCFNFFDVAEMFRVELFVIALLVPVLPAPVRPVRTLIVNVLPCPGHGR